MTRNSIARAGSFAAVPLVLWFAAQAIAGVGPDKPSIPQGAHLIGPASVGTITYSVNPALTPTATIQFDGQCGDKAVTTPPLDVTQITNVAFFASATSKQIAKVLEEFFVSNSMAVNAFQSCYRQPLVGVYITAVSRTITKTPTLWVGEAVVLGVAF